MNDVGWHAHRMQYYDQSQVVNPTYLQVRHITKKDFCFSSRRASEGGKVVSPFFGRASFEVIPPSHKTQNPLSILSAAAQRKTLNVRVIIVDSFTSCLVYPDADCSIFQSTFRVKSE